MNPSKTSTLSTILPRFNLIKSIACSFALLASGQSFAVNYYYSQTSIASASDFMDGSKWATNGCGGSLAVSPITVQATDSFIICNGHSLTLSATYIVNFQWLVFNSTGTWTSGGVLKFSSGSKEISNQNSSLAPIALNVSSMTTGNTIIIQTGRGVFPPVTFSSVTGGSLSCGGSPYTAGNAIPSGTTCTVTVTPAISAPIDFSFNHKSVEIYSTEIELK